MTVKRSRGAVGPPPLPACSHAGFSAVEGDSLSTFRSMDFLATSDSQFLRRLREAPGNDFPLTAALAERGAVLDASAVRLADDAASKITAGTPRTEVVDEYRWLVVRAHVRQVTGLSARVTARGFTLVVDVVVEEHDGTSYAVKDLPLALAKGPPLWKWWMQLPEGNHIRRLLARIWPQYVDMASAATISARLAATVENDTPSGQPRTSTIGECNGNKVKHRLQTPWAAPPTGEKLSSMIKGGTPVRIGESTR